uniref:Sorting nexin-14-like n=1 Tax=Phallusia mammillata TaxID=59560 RepID=A0A6F9DUA5_9ASCI|nr:sorting nexin-14-like [Phallusia mammillata]
MNHTKMKAYGVGAAAAVFATLLTMSVFHFMLLFWAFFAGVALCVIILRPGYEIPNLLLSFYKQNQMSIFQSGALKPSTCTVCGKEDCERQKPEDQFEVSQPWIDIKVNEKVDKAVTEFLEILIERHIRNWYKDLSENEDFIHELKCCLRHCLAVLYRRINKIDLPEAIIKKLVKKAIYHLNICLLAQKSGCVGEDDILMFYGKQKHVALQSRRNELDYIRGICDCLFPIILPQVFTKSKIGTAFLREVLASNVILHGIDSIEDPDRINHLLLIFFDESPPREADCPPGPLVPFLAEFASNDHTNSTSLLHIDLPKIMTTQDMLYQFMSFLKTIRAVHYLQFCLTVDDFNRRCLAPEQNDEQQKKLHEEACNIYKSYCDPTSPTFIHFQQSIIDDLAEIANGRWDEVCRLRTSTPLFQAYDHVYNLLEHLYCPLFYQSDIYYQMLCGKRAPSKTKKIGRQGAMARYGEGGSGSVKQIGKKIKEAFKPMADNGLMDETDADMDLNLLEEPSQLLLDDDIEEEIQITRDVSAWRIEIPKIDVKKDDDANLKFFFFQVDVKRVNLSEDDEEPEKWHVLRRYPEFYVLESKLTEFHGSLTPNVLPNKKIFTPNFDFLDSKRGEFERFLKELVTKPALRHSELLYDFLLPSNAEAISRFDKKFLPDVKIGKFFRRVPTKLVKEKGQHLDSFLQTFIQSCESPKPKPGKYEPTTDNPGVQMDHKLHSELFPESDWQTDSFPITGNNRKTEKDYLTGVSDYLIYMATQVFDAGERIHRVMLCFKTLFKNTLEPFVHGYLKQKIDCYRQEHHVVDLVHLFRDIVFFNKDPPRTEKEKAQRRNETLQCWKDFIPGHFVKIIGKEKHEMGCNKVFHILQQPKLNKQLGYMLLDTILLELFPELLNDQGTN